MSGGLAGGVPMVWLVSVGTGLTSAHERSGIGGYGEYRVHRYCTSQIGMSGCDRHQVS